MTPAAQLWKWFRQRARDLPWRATRKDGTRDPYHVWLAEIMLQQTQVATVTPYYKKFLRHYPTLAALARAPSERVLADWAGLGYYSRARNLHKCAQIVVNERGDTWPRSAAELQKLPGLGPYTAAAMAALAFGENVLAIDGNVMRVIARYGAIGKPVTAARPKFLSVGKTLLHAPANGGSAEALIELGALICTPQSPRCDICPLHKTCKAFAADKVMAYPVKTVSAVPQPRAATVLILTNPAGEIFTITRGGKGLFAGMRGLPTTALAPGEEDHPALAGRKAKAKLIGAAEHTLSHIRFGLSVLHQRLTVREAAKLSALGTWMPHETLQKQMPKLFQKALERLDR